jgi:hypothetical protein
MINVSQAVIDCLTERDGDKNVVPRSPESVSCRELEHKLQNVLVISTEKSDHNSASNRQYARNSACNKFDHNSAAHPTEESKISTVTIRPNLRHQFCP